jgi:hypothetical protein
VCQGRCTDHKEAWKREKDADGEDMFGKISNDLGALMALIKNEGREDLKQVFNELLQYREYIVSQKKVSSHAFERVLFLIGSFFCRSICSSGTLIA